MPETLWSTRNQVPARPLSVAATTAPDQREPQSARESAFTPVPTVERTLLDVSKMPGRDVHPYGERAASVLRDARLQFITQRNSGFRLARMFLRKSARGTTARLQMVQTVSIDGEISLPLDWRRNAVCWARR